MLGWRFVGNLDGVSKKNALDARHIERPTRYIDFQSDKSAETAPRVCRASQLNVEIQVGREEVNVKSLADIIEAPAKPQP